MVVLVSLRDFKERFADRDAFDERRRLVAEVHAFRARQVETGSSVVAELRALRDER